MTMRAKMKLNVIVGQSWGGAKAIFNCEYDPTIADDLKFCKATPTGMCEMVIDNPAALEQLVIGKHYYVDFTPAE